MRGFVKFVFLVIAVGFGVKVLGDMNTPKSPEEIAQKAKDDEIFSKDYRTLKDIGTLVVASGSATKFNISGFHESLDLYLGTTSAERADRLAAFVCRDNFTHVTLDWNVRVYLVDDRLGAQCRIEHQKTSQQPAATPVSDSSGKQDRSIQYDPTEAQEAALFDQAKFQTLGCLDEAITLFLRQGVRDRDRLAETASTMCGEAIDAAMTRARQSHEQAHAFVKVLAYQEIERVARRGQ